ncbi:MAG: hypothetical protein ABDH37_02005 [Candidatus Hydrothermales bacterium]
MSIYLLFFDNYGLLKFFSLKGKLKELDERKNFLMAKQIIYKDRIKFLKSDVGKKIKKYF